MTTRKKLIELGGKLKFLILKYVDSQRILYLLVQNKQKPVIVTALLLQYKETETKTIIYIEALDTTGFFVPRDRQSIFTKAFILSAIQEHSSNLVCVFSHPKDELIFGKSSENCSKGKMSPRKLMRYWTDLLESIPGSKLDIVSNYHSTLSYPAEYRTIDDLYLFEDDPKKKLLKETDGQITIKELFNMLVYRKDFIKGSLIYCNMSNADNVKGISNNNSMHECDINEILDYLRKSDFANEDSATKATANFMETYGYTSGWFTTDDSSITKASKQQIPIISIVPRKNE